MEESGASERAISDAVRRRIWFVGCPGMPERASVEEECGKLELLWGAMLERGDDGTGMCWVQENVGKGL